MSANKDGFAQLLETLNNIEDDTKTLLVKSDPAKVDDDKKVVAAAEDGGVKVDGAAGAGAGAEGGGEGEEEDEGAEFGKSLGTTEGGEKLIDATELVKSLVERLDSTDDVLAKALASFNGVLQSQNELIKSLQAEIKTLGGQGRGRKALLTVVEKPAVGTLAKSEGATEEGKITPEELLAKSNAAYAAKKISGVELTTIDVCLRNNQPISPVILQKVALAS